MLKTGNLAAKMSTGKFNVFPSDAVVYIDTALFK